MLKTTKSYIVMREYQCMYDTEELIRRIIRHHIMDAYEKEKASGCARHEAGSHARYEK